MLLSDQAKYLVKIVLRVGAVCLLFKRCFTTWILNKSTVSREKFHVTIPMEKARVLRSNLTMFRPCGSIMGGFRKCCGCRQSRLLFNLPKVLTGMWLSSCCQKTLCQA